MLSQPLKRRLIRYANTGTDQRAPLRTGLDLPKTILGRKIYQSKTMSHSYHWNKLIEGEVLYDELLSAYTSMRTGGPADVFLVPKHLKDLETIFQHRGNTPLLVIGEGTNLIARDKGFRGIVIYLRDQFKSVNRPLFYKTLEGKEKAVIKAGAGVKLSYLAKYAARFGLTGIEYLVGIPGSLGGAVVMNAGAEGTETGQVLKSVTRMTYDGKIQTLKKENLNFEYRKTIFPPGEGIIIEAELDLEKGNPEKIHEKMNQHLSRRSATQPLNLPNSGSVFKNPPGNTAGQIIEAAGLKGYRIGGAAVSIKHANFIVNKQNATASDVALLVDHIRQVVKEKVGIELETEIIFVGE